MDGVHLQGETPTTEFADSAGLKPGYSHCVKRHVNRALLDHISYSEQATRSLVPY